MIRLFVFLILFPAALWAAPPRVVTDIAPVHSLTMQVLGDIGTADLLLPANADAHDFALRPSDAQRLSTADLVIWVGPGLTPWLKEPLETLAANADQLRLLDTTGWTPLPVRSQGDHGDHDGHDHDNDHAHHGDIDPHAWLDPSVGRAWIAAIATALGAADPDNAAIYAINAATAIAELNLLEADLQMQLGSVNATGYILPHDGYQYFENRYNLQAAGQIAGIDGRDPGPAHIADLRAQLGSADIRCIFSDVEIGPRWVALVGEGYDLRSARLDTTGSDIPVGPALYAQLLRKMGQAFVDCLGKAP